MSRHYINVVQAALFALPTFVPQLQKLNRHPAFNVGAGMVSTTALFLGFLGKGDAGDHQPHPPRRAGSAARRNRHPSAGGSQLPGRACGTGRRRRRRLGRGRAGRPRSRRPGAHRPLAGAGPGPRRPEGRHRRQGQLPGPGRRQGAQPGHQQAADAGRGCVPVHRHRPGTRAASRGPARAGRHGRQRSPAGGRESRTHREIRPGGLHRCRLRDHDRPDVPRPDRDGGPGVRRGVHRGPDGRQRPQSQRHAPRCARRVQVVRGAQPRDDRGADGQPRRGRFHREEHHRHAGGGSGHGPAQRVHSRTGGPPGRRGPGKDVRGTAVDAACGTLPERCAASGTTRSSGCGSGSWARHRHRYRRASRSTRSRSRRFRATRPWPPEQAGGMPLAYSRRSMYTACAP